MTAKEVIAEFIGKKCTVCKINNVTTIVRCRYTCDYCFNLLLRDNKKRIRKKINIPNNTSILQSCFKYRCINKFERKLDFETNDPGFKTLKKEYCSEECEVKDKLIKLRSMMQPVGTSR